MWPLCFIILAVIKEINSINRPAFKVVLTQKGFTQFVQYDLETPPIRELTFCTWIRPLELSADQSVFTYIANGGSRVLRLWLDTGGRHIKISVNGKASSNTAVDIHKDTWHHICLSYQSDYGAWALYVDGRLASCEAAQSLYGYVLPGGGSIIVGYGTAENGASYGFEGEIFGVNILLASTIERNYTIKNHPQYQQKSFHRNVLKNDDDDVKYIVLGQQLTSPTTDNYETAKHANINSTRSFIKFKSPYSQFEHDVGAELTSFQTVMDVSREKEFLDLSTLEKNIANDNKINFWNVVNEAGRSGKFKGHTNNKNEQFSSSTEDQPMLSEFETPPPPGPIDDIFLSPFKVKKTPKNLLFETNLNNILSATKNTKINKYEILDMEAPPPVEKKTKVYGQWTNSLFANDVLSYLKSINSNSRPQNNVPPTIPLLKISDSFPYPSDFKATKVYAPHKFQRRNFMDKRLQISKRETIHPQINVEILENDLRSQILNEHANTHPQNVEITSRGEVKKHKDNRYYRNVQNQISEEIMTSNDNHKSSPFVSASELKFDYKPRKFESQNTRSLINILPFLKSTEYFIGDLEDHHKMVEKNKMYTKSLSSGNKWHNVKSYSNNYSPQEKNTDSEEAFHKLDYKVAEANKRPPSIRLKYKPDQNKVIKNHDNTAIVDGQKLAIEITNLSDSNVNEVSILKYNHGYLSNHKNNPMNIKKSASSPKKNANNFNQHVKIGNALNERIIIGESGEENKVSFVGGNRNVPDINRYRSDIDNTKEYVPPSLGPRICKNVELYDRLFYVQPDGSVDVTHILSPVKEKNIGIEFIVQNYKKCSLQESFLEKHALLLIDWNKTPVRLFGGAKPKQTKDLCGFF